MEASIISTKYGLVYWHTYGSLGLDELMGPFDKSNAVYFKSVTTGLSRFNGRHPNLHLSDSDAGWNSTRHPMWPRAISEEFYPLLTIDEWGCYVLVYADIVAEPQLVKWTNNWVFNACDNGLMLGGDYFISTQHLLSISTQHPDGKYSSDITLSGAYHDFISHLLG